MKYQRLSTRQNLAMTWWNRPGFEVYDGIICDGSIRSGKTVAMTVGFIMWAMTRFDGCNFAICGKTIESLRRNVTSNLPVWLAGVFSFKEHRTENKIVVSANGKSNSFYLFGGKDESSAALIQGITLAGILLDEVALMPESFVNQATARCSVEGAKLWFNCNPEGPSHWFYTKWVLEPDSFAYSGPYIITQQDDETGKVEGYNWERIPLVCFKSSHHEIPLLSKVKCLQDAYNNILSNFANQMEEDIHTTILVIKNYDGEDLGTFRRNLATYGAIKVRSYEGAEGGVDTLEISVNAENYKTLLALLKDAIIENARGYDAKDDRMSGDPNQMNIQSMYSDIDLDANGIEMEFQASMEELLWFINKHLANTGGRSFEGEDVTVIFDRDVLINETEAINNCKNSVGILSDETIVKMHPWVTDPEQELQRIKDEKEEAMQADPYQAAFLANRNRPPVNNEGGGDGKTD